MDVCVRNNSFSLRIIFPQITGAGNTRVSRDPDPMMNQPVIEEMDLPSCHTVKAEHIDTDDTNIGTLCEEANTYDGID